MTISFAGVAVYGPPCKTIGNDGRSGCQYTVIRCRPNAGSGAEKKMAARGGSHRLSLSGSGEYRFRMDEEAYGGVGLLAIATQTAVRGMGSTALELSTEDRDAGN